MMTDEDRIRTRIHLLETCRQQATTQEERDSYERQINQLWRQLSS